VATVTGELREDVKFVDIIKATFPGGSITGAPKIRAMKIIDELEPTQRNIYTGSIGYLDLNGNIDLNIAIRTIVVKDEKAFFQVGGAIVWDSDKESEYRETILKGKALRKAIEG
jgi:para-aminobenzoate synthetase component 1